MKKLLICSFLLSGCLSEKKLAKVCAEKYPIKEEVKEILVVDTIYGQPDTIVAYLKDSNLTYICPPVQTIIQKKEVIKTQENTAKIEALKIAHSKELAECKDNFNKQQELYNKELTRLKKDLAKAEDKVESLSKYKRWFILSIIGLLLYFAIRNKWLRLPL